MAKLFLAPASLSLLDVSGCQSVTNLFVDSHTGETDRQTLFVEFVRLLVCLFVCFPFLPSFYLTGNNAACSRDRNRNKTAFSVYINSTALSANSVLAFLASCGFGCALVNDVEVITVHCCCDFIIVLLVLL